MKSNKSFFGLFLAVLVILPGCMRVSTYKPRSLQLVSDDCTYRGTENNVIVRAKLLSRADKSNLFDSQSELIHNNDIQVIYLSMHNLSGVHYLFSPVNIDLTVMLQSDVARLMQTSSVGGFGKGIGSGAISAGLIASGVSLPMLCQSMIIAYVAFPLGVVAAAMTFMFVGTSIKSIVMNRRISKDLAEKVLHKKVILNSGEQYEGLIFVKSSDYTPQFIVTMHDKKKKKNSVTFDIDLRQNEQQT